MRKRSNRKPRELVNPLTFLKPLDADQQRALLLRCYTALNTMTTGQQAGPNDWRDLADVLNIIETMALHTGHLNPVQVLPSCEQVTDSIRAAQSRFRRGLGLRLDGMGLNAMRLLLSIYSEAISVLTAHEVAGIIKETQRQVAKAARENTNVVSL